MKENRFPSLRMFCRSLALFFAAAFVPQISLGSNFYQGVASNSVSWPGGIVPYVFATNLTTNEQAIYLAGMREWELAANIHFTNRTTQTNYVLLQFDYTQGTDTFVASFPEAVMTVDTLQRSQVAHETGHLLGLQHEHVRTDRNTYITVNFSNLVSSGSGGTNGSGEGSSISSLYQIDSNSTAYGTYDFQSVMHYSRTLFSSNPATLDVLVPNASNFTEYYYRIGNYTLSSGDRAGAAYLYGPPTTPITNIVTNTADVGLGSLRAAIYYANDHPGTTISFNISTNDPGYSNGVYTIYTSGQLPPLVANGTVIDATTQPGYVNHPIVAIDGSKLSPELAYPNDLFATGFYVYAANCVINGLAINNFNFVGIDVEYALAISNRIEGCYLGISPNGTSAAPNICQGISIDTGASHNFVGGTNASQRNVISGNTQYGVLIIGTNGLYGATVIGSNVNNNTVLGNYIGLNGAGTAALGNLKSGIGIYGGASSNVVGGLTSGSRNVISGNAEYGVFISDSNTVGTLVQGNYIGSDVTGTTGVPNTNSGIGIYTGANNVLVGGTNAGARNLLSGNSGAGVLLGGTAISNTIQGNYVGVASNGMSALPNLTQGIYLLSGPQSNLIGGTVTGAGNLISGNVGYGIQFYGAGTSFNLVQGNYIGTASNGTTALPNTSNGVYVEFANSNTIGGAVAGAGNVISGNSGDGIQLYGATASLNLIQGNYIGVATNGTTALGNGSYGVYLEFAPSNAVGGTLPGMSNIISGNGSVGVLIYGNTATQNVVAGNYVGVDKTGTIAIPNNDDGVSLSSGAQFNTVGGTAAGAANVISGNTGSGVSLFASGTSHNLVVGNLIGTDKTGVNAIANGANGVTLSGGPTANTIGGTSAAARNVIGESLESGLYFYDASNNVVQGNYFGANATGNTALSNVQYGIYMVGASSGNLIGGTTAGAGNVVVASGFNGVYISDAGTTGNLFQGNSFGVGANGTTALGNGGQAFWIQGGASNNVLGLATNGAGAGNIIAYSQFEGLIMWDAITVGNTIRGNSIFSNGNLGINLIGGTEDIYGTTANDANDTDTGPNNLQNYPVITSVSVAGATTTVSGTLNSTPSRGFVLDFYQDAVADRSGHGQGQVYAGGTNVMTAASGNASFTYAFNNSVANQFYAATATDLKTGDTSEFSADVQSTNTATVTPPTIYGPFTYSSSTGFGMNVALSAGQSYHVQASTNLSTTNWVNLTNFTAGGTNFAFTDHGATNWGKRFYRVVSP